MEKAIYVTHDEVNPCWLQQQADEHRVPLVLLTLRDLVPDEEHGPVLLDWDSLDHERREAFLGRLLSHPSNARIGLHSYSLNEQDAEDLRRKGWPCSNASIPRRSTASWATAGNSRNADLQRLIIVKGWEAEHGLRDRPFNVRERALRLSPRIRVRRPRPSPSCLRSPRRGVGCWG